MAGGDSGSQVVCTYPGPGTGDVVVVTADGRRWESVQSTPVETGTRYGELRDGRVVPLPERRGGW